MLNNIIVIYCKILVIQEGLYKEIVVEDLNRDFTDDLKYIAVVKLPNWEPSMTFNVGDIGYLQFQYVEGGVTKWFNKNLEDFKSYKYTNNYFIRFIKKEDLCKQDKFDFE